MALAITRDGEVGINGYKYKLASPLTERLLSRLPAKINIGPDSYSQENYLSNWIINDQRGGILINEMDESVHADRCWWTNCIIDYKGHITLPRLATGISGTGDGWASPESAAGDASGIAWANDTNAIDSDTSTAMTTSTTNVNDQWTEFEEFTITSAKIDSIRYYTTVDTAKWDVLDIDVYYDSAWHGIYTGTPTANAWTTVAIGSTESVTKARVRLQHNGTSTDSCTFSEIDFGMATPASDYSGESSYLFENFNGDLYMAAGAMLLKLDSSRNFFLLRTFSASITALKSSLNSELYIYLGDSTNYYHMDTNEYIVQSDSANAYWAEQYADELYKLNSSGTFSASSDPDGGSPTWSNEGDITDIASQIEGLLVGRDADGNPVIYCPTNSILKVYDDTNTKWLDTEVRLPNHPNGGKGYAYWNGAIYLSYGLGVKKYIPGSTGSVSEVGLNRDDGLPYEYNGEIVKFNGDSEKDLFALIDASQVSGTGSSGLYAWNGRAWRCFWVDSNDDAAMHDVIVSPAESEYAVYWDCGGAIYYIDLSRGNSNPANLVGMTTYESYTSGDDSNQIVYGSNWKAQSFTPSSDHTVTGVALLLRRRGSPGTLTVSIKATDGSGKPTGSDLCSGTVDGNTLTEDNSGEWIYISFGAGYSLTASTKYAIVARATSGSSNNEVYWRADLTSASYSGGEYLSSSNSGSTWGTGVGTYDFLFIEYDASGAQYYASSGILVTPKFDGGSVAFQKLITKLVSFTKGITSNETITIKYRKDSEYNDITNGWTTLVTLDSTTEAGQLETLIASGAGMIFQNIQFRLDFARGTNTTLTPDLYALVSSYLLVTGENNNKAWNFTINIDDTVDNTKPKEKYENIWLALQSSTLVPFIFRRDDTNETHYVQLFLNGGFTPTGDFYTGQMNLTAVEL